MTQQEEPRLSQIAGMKGLSPRHILLVEDNTDHAAILIRAMKKNWAGTDLIWARDGQEAMAYLGRRQGEEENPIPELILLDIQLPRMNGIELLEGLKSNPALAGVPVVMLTTTDHPEEVRKCYDLGALGYVVKGATDGEFLRRLWSFFGETEHSQKPSSQSANGRGL